MARPVSYTHLDVYKRQQQNRQDLVDNANHIFDTYLQNGFSPAGFFNEVVHYLSLIHIYAGTFYYAYRCGKENPV